MIIMKVVEMFSGIGSQARALSKVASKRNINIKVELTCEWDIHAFLAYNYIHNKTEIDQSILDMTKEELVNVLSKYNLSSNGKSLMNPKQLKTFDDILLKNIYNSIIKDKNMVDIQNVKGSDIPNDIDLLTYSFPCQDLSNVGSFHGYKHGLDRDKKTRSGLLWEIERILEEKRTLNHALPRYLLLENVTALEAKRHRGNFVDWQEKLIDLGYLNKVYKLNAEDFGIPQYRKRIIMLSVFVGADENKKRIVENYFDRYDLNDFSNTKKLNIKTPNLEHFLRIDYSQEKYYLEALEAQPNDTISRRKIWNENSKILDENNNLACRAQTITTRQDRHPNSGNLYFDVNEKSKFRFLTPRECFLLMGFEEKDYDILIENNLHSRKNALFFSRDTLYKLAGNSIVVNILENVFNQVIDIDYILNDSERKNIFKAKERLASSF